MKKIVSILPFVLIGIYIIIASFQLSSPGLQYDEVLFTNAALGPIDKTFVDLKIGNFPVMLMSYIGALKAYLYFPIFKLFGVSAFTIRFPMILLSAFGLYILYKLTLRIFGNKTALIVLLLSFLDPLYISHSRMDVGPTVISFLCKTTVLYIFFLFIKQRSKGLFFALCVFLFLGLYNKLNFMWFVFAFFISSIVFYRKELTQFVNKIISKNLQRIFIILSIPLALIGLLVMKKLSFLDTIDFFYFKHLLYVIDGLINTLNGQLFLKQTLEMGRLVTAPYKVLGWIMALFIPLTIGVRLFTRFNSKEEQRSFYFLLGGALLIYFQIIITSLAGKSWHFFELYPIVPLLFSVSLVSLVENKTVLKILICLFLVYQIGLYYLYMKSYNAPDISPAWSKDIYRLIDFTKSQNRTFISMDWGTHNQLQAYDHIKGKYIDGWIYMGKQIPRNFYNARNFIIFHDDLTTFMPLAKEDFIKQLPARVPIQLYRTIGMYEVWEVKERK